MVLLCLPVPPASAGAVHLGTLTLLSAILLDTLFPPSSLQIQVFDLADTLYCKLQSPFGTTYYFICTHRDTNTFLAKIQNSFGKLYEILSEKALPCFIWFMQI